MGRPRGQSPSGRPLRRDRAALGPRRPLGSGAGAKHIATYICQSIQVEIIDM
jgi:hypothetical protein